MSQAIKILSTAFVLIVCIEICNSQTTSKELLLAATKFFADLDYAKENATTCKSLVSYSNNLKGLDDAAKESIQNLVPLMIEDCFSFLENIIMEKWDLFGLNETSLIGSKSLEMECKLDQTSEFLALTYDKSNSTIFLTILIDVAKEMGIKTLFKKTMLYEAKQTGVEFCTFIKTGVLNDIIKLVNDVFFDNPNGPNFNRMISSSPLSNYQALSRYKPNSYLKKLVSASMKCDECESKSILIIRPRKNSHEGTRYHPEHCLSPDYALNFLGTDPRCETLNLFVLIRLHNMKENLSLSQLSGMSGKLLSACLNAITTETMQSISRVTEQELPAKYLFHELINYSNNEFLRRANSSILDVINPRSFFENQIEMGVLLQRQLREKLAKLHVDATEVYETGKVICDKVKYLQFINTNQHTADQIKSVLMILSIKDLEIDLRPFLNHQKLMSVILWYLCNDLKLYPISYRNL